MEELLKAIDIAPAWALYALIFTALVKATIAIIRATSPLITSSKPQQALQAASFLTPYTIYLIALFIFLIFNIQKTPLVTVLVFAVFAVIATLIFVSDKYAKKHPDPMPRAPRTSSGRNPEKDQKLSRYLSVRPQHPRISQSLRLASSTAKARQVLRS